jgi:hypothetical protein
MRFYGHDFKQALSFLGIRSSATSSIQGHREIKARKRRRELIGLFREWERAALHHYSVLIRATYKAAEKLTPDNFEEYAGILDPLAYWGHCLDVLTIGDESERFLLFKEHHQKRAKLIRRKSLFRPDFNYRQWLKETEY